MAIASTQKAVPKIEFKELYFWDYSTKIREAVSIPLAYLGGVKSAENVAQCMEAGFEAVTLARALLREPDLVKKWQASPELESLCDNCNSGVAHIYHPAGTWCIHQPANKLEDNQILASAV